MNQLAGARPESGPPEREERPARGRAGVGAAGGAREAGAESAGLAGDAWKRLEALRAEARAAGLCPVRPRLLKQIIRAERDLIGLGVDAPHEHAFVMARDALARLVDQEGYLLDLDGVRDPALLVAEPAPEELTALSDDALRARLLAQELHCRAHALVAARGRLDESSARAFADEVGHDPVEEARIALAAEHRLFEGDGLPELLEELAVVYAELRALAPGLIHVWFPSLPDRRLEEAIARRWPALLDARELLGPGRAELARTLARPETPDDDGPELPDPAAGEREDAASEDAASAIPAASAAPEAAGRAAAPAGPPGAAADAARAARVHALLARAAHHAARGHLVGAMRCRRSAQALTSDPREVRARTLENDGDLQRLAERLHRAIGAAEPTAERWTQVLRPLVRDMGVGRWSRRARLLYDLQRVCVDAEQPGFAVRLGRFLWSRGKEPIRQTLDDQVPVRVHRHLRTALARALDLPVPREVRGPLLAALRHAEHAAAARIRQRFRPEVEAVLREVGLVPRSLPEAVAARKLTEELLDRIVARDYMGFGDLRDAISSNNLKMQDMSSPWRLIAGDALIDADRRLAARLEGVYRKSPFYMRLLQRLSSLAFGNRVGRALTRFVAIPFTGAFVALEGLTHMVAPVAKLLGLGHPHLATAPGVLGLGAVTLAFLESPALRARTVLVLAAIGRGVVRVVRDLPRAALHHPAVRRVLDSYGMAITRRFVLKPLVPAGLGLLAASVAGAAPRDRALVAAGLFLAASAFINSRFGRVLEARLGDELQLVWGRIRHRLLPNLFRFVMDTSRRVRSAIERLAYTVDEVLRFRQGDARVALFAKLVGGSIWSAVMYVVQLYVNLLVEPQLNPIKHFPVVTVSHKVILPATGQLVRLFKAPLDPVLGGYLAGTIAGVTVFLLPGLFGFLVWELSANWRLYEASRPARLGAVRVGGHGESVSGLLRPGFHAGTIPKLFARIRKKALEAHRRHMDSPRGKDHEELHHQVEAVERFIDRELCALVEATGAIPGRLRIGPVELGLARVRVELEPAAESALAAGYPLPADPESPHPPPLALVIAERRGRLVARVEPGFAAGLPDPARRALSDAVLGLLWRADVDAVEVAGEERPLRPHAIEWSAWVARWREEGGADRGAPAPFAPALIG